MATIHHLHRQAGTVPAHHKGHPGSVRPMTGAEIVSLTGDTKAAYRHDVLDHGDAKYCEPADIIGAVKRSIRKQHRAYQARNAAIIASHPEGQVFARFAGKPRHVRIEPPIDWTKLLAIAVAVFCVSFFAAAFVSAWGAK